MVQIFDSWAGFIPEKKINEYCFAPNKKIVEFCKKEKIPNICFPKGLRKKYLEFNNIVQPDGINIDYEIEPSWAKKNLKNVVNWIEENSKIEFICASYPPRCSGGKQVDGLPPV